MSLKDLEERLRRLENSRYNIVGELNPSVADAPMVGGHLGASPLWLPFQPALDTVWTRHY